MSAIVKYPAVGEEALPRFSHLFANDPERRHFAEYLTGLMVAHKKNVSAINRERLDWLQDSPHTRYHRSSLLMNWPTILWL